MALIILKCENQYEKVHRICAEFTKTVNRIYKFHAVAVFSVFQCTILTTLHLVDTCLLTDFAGMLQSVANENHSDYSSRGMK